MTSAQAVYGRESRLVIGRDNEIWASFRDKLIHKNVRSWRELKSVIEIAQNYRKKTISCELSVNQISPEKIKIFTRTNSVKILKVGHSYKNDLKN